MAEVAERLGTPLMPWQRLVADVALEVDPTTRRLVYREVVLTVPRQSGKTTLLLSVLVQRALGFGGRQRMVYTAQTRNDARQKWEDDHVVTLEHSVFKPMFRVRKSNGSEAIKWKNGSSHGIAATTEKSGHGLTLDLGVIDEAFAQPDSRLEQAMKPAMITRPQPQLWVVSTAGKPESSHYLWNKVETGRQRAELGITDSVAYFEWSAPDDADPGDPETWRSCMPALGHTVTEAAIAADFASMPLPEFRRAYTNQWVGGESDPVIPPAAWEAAADPGSQIDGPVAFSFDVTPDRSWSAISAAGLRSDGRTHIEVIDHRAGTGWVPARLAELADRWSPVAVACDVSGAAGSLVSEVERLGVPVVPVSARDHTQACGGFFDSVVEDRLRYRPHAALSSAADGAVKRPLGDAWAWSRKNSSVDICPLVAATLAGWALGSVESLDVLGSVW